LVDDRVIELINVVVDTDADGILVNSTSVSGSQTDPDVSNNQPQ